MLMNRLDFLTMREQVMENIDVICDTSLAGLVPQSEIDQLVTVLCDSVCDTMDPAGLE